MSEACWKTLRAYGELFETLRPETLNQLDALVDERVAFRDPFHAVTGRDAMKRVLAGMFTAFRNPKFAVNDLAMGETRGFVAWRFESGAPDDDDAVAFDGTSTVSFGRDAMIVEHRDHWDAASAIHARLPLIGPAVRFVNRSIARKTG